MAFVKNQQKKRKKKKTLVFDHPVLVDWALYTRH